MPGMTDNISIHPGRKSKEGKKSTNFLPLINLWKRTKIKRRVTATNHEGLRVENPPTPAIIGEYIPQEWFKMVEEDKDEEEVLLLCITIVVDINY